MKLKKRIKLPKKKKDKFEEEEYIEDTLKRRQRLFVKYYCGEGAFNGQKSAELAGYKKLSARKTAYELLKKPEIQILIEEEIKKKTEKIDLTEEKILQDLELARKAAFYKERYGVSVKASEIMGKKLGMWTDKVTHDIDEHAAGLFEMRQKEVYETLKRMCPTYERDIVNPFKEKTEKQKLIAEYKQDDNNYGKVPRKRLKRKPGKKVQLSTNDRVDPTHTQKNFLDDKKEKEEPEPKYPSIANWKPWNGSFDDF